MAVLALGIVTIGGAVAQEKVTFPSLDGRTTLTAYLMRPPGDERLRPALVFLHGCSGLRGGERIFGLYRAWSAELTARGYVVLMVDSAGSRGFGATCVRSEARMTMLRDRPKDAYGALAWLQAQPFVKPDKVGMIGWSLGGATVLLSVGTKSIGRPEPPPREDFRVAVAFYPGACNDRFQSRPFVEAVAPQSWTTTIPLLILFGDADNWTPFEPCRAFAEGARGRGAPVEFKAYPGALHAFDAPGGQRRALTQYRTDDGRVPEVGPDPAARADAYVRVPEFLARFLQ